MYIYSSGNLLPAGGDLLFQITTKPKPPACARLCVCFCVLSYYYTLFCCLAVICMGVCAVLHHWCNCLAK